MKQPGTPQPDSNALDGQRFIHALPGFRFTLTLSPDAMECRGQLERNDTGEPPRLEELEQLVSESGIVIGIDQTALERLLIDARPGHPASETLARGSAPITGENGYLSFHVVPLNRTAGEIAQQDPDARQIDFHAVQQFINVEPEQPFASVIPPTPGTPGCTVLGAELPANPGAPVTITCGDNCRFSDDGVSLISAIHGRVRRQGDTISISDEYVVDGDLDYTVGNIQFNGRVEIHGDVLDGFSISASKGIKITGNVGSCSLYSQGDIEFCGMDGQGSGNLFCGGALTANFIHGSRIECRGPLLAHVELRDCAVYCGGTVSAGMISGGVTIARGGVTTKRIGSPAGLKTRIQAGIDYQDQLRLEELIHQVSDLHETIAHTRNDDELQQLKAEKQRLIDLAVQLRKRRPDGSNPKINVRKQLYEGVTLLLGNACEETSFQQDGPFSLIENRVAGGLRYLPLTALEIPAEQDEQTFLAQQAAEQDADAG